MINKTALTRHRTMCLFVSVLFGLLIRPDASAQVSSTSTSNDPILIMLQAGMSDEAIVNAVSRLSSKGQANFDVSEQGLAALRKAGASPTLIEAIEASVAHKSTTPDRRGPPPDSAPKGPQDQAVTLATRVLVGGPDAREALLEAMRLSGFNVRDADGSFVVNQESNPQPIGFEMWEVTMLADEGHHLRMPISTLSSVLVSAIPSLRHLEVDAVIVDSIRKSAQSSEPRLHFWGGFIIALGRLPLGGCDLASDVAVAKVSFDTVQIAFILHRLAGELGELAASKGALAIPKHTAFSRSSSPYAVDNTVFRRTDQAIFNRVAEVSDESPCNATSEVEKFVMDVAVVRVGSFVFKGVWAELDKETIGIPPALLSALMQYVRLLAIYGKTLDIGFTMEPGPPLVRTHSSSKDEQRRTITATVSRKPLPALDWINCVRNLAAGYGVALPAFESGRLKSAAVDWQIIEGQSIVRVVGDPANRIQTGTAVSPVQRVPTNNEGQVAVVVEGIRQRQQIPDFALPVNKQATIEARVQLSRMSLGQDISAIGWAGKTGPSVAAASSVLAGMIEKTSIFSPFSYPFEVTDWRVALELYFESKMTMRKPWLVSTQSWHVQATVPISLDYNSEEILQYQSRLLGDAQIELLDHKNTTRLRYDSADCKENGIGDLGRLLVAGDPSSQRFLTEDPVHIHLGIAIHDYSYNDTVTCIGPATVTIGVTNFAAVFGGAHASEITPTSYPVTAIDITDWDAASPNASPGEGSAIARKTYDRTVQWNYSSIDEKTLIELRFAQRRQSP